jgi:nucleoside-diphosphate-sugar epimerase
MKILITGGNGNIAKMIKHNLSYCYDITTISRNDFDLLNYKSISTYLCNNHFDILIHTAIKGGRRTKEETADVVYQNLIMFENLMKFANNFKLIINFDSGAIYDRSTDIYCKKEGELETIPEDYYGFSKYVIYKRCLEYSNVVTFRIFNIFHTNEESDRFIKSCYIAKNNGTNIQIFQDKYFDFMYEDDFIEITKYYIDNFEKNLPKTINMSYMDKYKLSSIAELIIQDKIKINILDESCSKNYCGDGTELFNLCIQTQGLKSSLKKYEEKMNKNE